MNFVQSKVADISAELVSRIRSRCTAQGACLVWISPKEGSKNATRDGGPIIKMEGKTYQVRRAFWRFHNGEVPAGHFVTAGCDTPGCIEHLRTKSQHEQNLQLAAAHNSNPLRCARIAMTMRARYSTLDDDKVALIRYGEKPAAVYAREFDINEGQAARIRRGEAHKVYEIGLDTAWGMHLPAPKLTVAPAKTSWSAQQR